MIKEIINVQNQPNSDVNNNNKLPIDEEKVDISIQILKELLNKSEFKSDVKNDKCDQSQISNNNKELLGNLINNISLVSNNIIRIFDVLRETNFVKIQELIETIHQMFVKIQLGDDFEQNNVHDIRKANSINMQSNSAHKVNMD
jgi:hypothetical protein